MYYVDPSGHAITPCLKDAYSKQREQQKKDRIEDYNSQRAKKDAYEAAKKVVEENKQSKGPYSNIPDGKNVGPGKDFTAAQKKKILEENAKRNGGIVKSDDPNDYYDTIH